MGLFVNPDNSAFQMTLNSPIYVDKTELIEYTNSVLNTDNAFICSSRPRRFGKSITANMLTAYYSRGCKSEDMFLPLEISKNVDFRKYQVDFEKVKCWYDGYLLESYQVYNPKAVVSVMTKKRFKSYWSETGTYEAIVPLIKMDFDGLKKEIIEMLSGSSVEVDVTSFQNDIVSFVNKDDVLTYLIHLGYLGYDQNTETAFIPNEEIRQELIKATRRTQ